MPQLGGDAEQAELGGDVQGSAAEPAECPQCRVLHAEIRRLKQRIAVLTQAGKRTWDLLILSNQEVVRLRREVRSKTRQLPPPAELEAQQKSSACPWPIETSRCRSCVLRSSPSVGRCRTCALRSSRSAKRTLRSRRFLRASYKKGGVHFGEVLCRLFRWTCPDAREQSGSSEKKR
ncbi:unnamed protein product [Symbiodinium sp. CCMP2592]|nr:unnamed protein product [Symbiodinium sp. CCMP2592]